MRRTSVGVAGMDSISIAMGTLTLEKCSPMWRNTHWGLPMTGLPRETDSGVGVQFKDSLKILVRPSLRGQPENPDGWDPILDSLTLTTTSGMK